MEKSKISLGNLLKKWLTAAEKQAPAQHREKTADCLELNELGDYLDGRLLDDRKRKHVINCSYCHRTVATAFSEIKAKYNVTIAIGKDGKPVVKSRSKGVEIIGKSPVYVRLG